MIRNKALRSLFAGRLEESRQAGGERAYGRGRLAALTEWHDTIGLETDPRSGSPMIPVDERGLPCLKAGRAAASEVSIRGLAEAIMGHETVDELYHPAGGFPFMDLQEAAIDPSAMIDINTFNLATAGLLQAEIMERFMQPEFIGRDLVRIVPTRKNADKLIAVARMAPVAKASKGRLPGEAHAEVGFGQAFQTTPETLEQALKVLVTKEVVFFDISDQVIEEAGEVGHELGYGMEKDIANEVMGVTNTYNRNGTSFNTYQTTSPWVNDIVNPFADITSVDTARQQFVGMTDPESGKEILVNSYTILAMPGRELRFREQLFAPTIQSGTQPSSGYPQRRALTGNLINQVGGGTYTLVPLTAIWYNRAQAADGLNLSASDAREYWWITDGAGKGFEFRENWPLTPWQAAADQFQLQDRGLVLATGASYRGVPYSREPRRTCRNKPS